ncbi:MAG: efflux RND transporter periplasmic adaptor subunit [Gammaproteobacteria bacterium]|nr:efflux RND transporter periplasmic adaptor subunit [Gammaproteobacteria bacterium]
MAAIAVLATSAACSDEPSSDSEEPSVRVQVATAEHHSMAETVRGIGTLRALQTVELRPETAGRITHMRFEEGGRVAAGEVLFELDTRKLDRELMSRTAALEAAEARQENAERELARVERLFEQNAASEDARDQAATELRAARAEVRRLESEVSLARERLADMRIRAPFDGMISDALVDEGDFVQAGALLGTTYQTGALEIEFTVPERHSGRIAAGQHVDLTVSAYPNRTFSATTTFVSPSVSDDTRDFLVKARLENPDALLKPGTFATALLTVAERDDALVIPEEALIATREGYMVFIVNDEDRAQRRRVDIGLRNPGIVEVTEGLEPGDRVVRTGHMRVADGAPLSIAEPDDDAA